MISARNALFSFLFALIALFAARPAQAQVRWDANIQAGASGRLFSNGGGSGIPGSLGPVVGLEGDLALIPLVRLGLYGDYEYASTTEPVASSVVSFGARVKFMIPGYRSNLHWWLFSGLGAVVWEAPAFTIPNCSDPTCAGTATAASGYFGEVPLGVGMGWRVRRPWELVAELQGRFGFDMNGSYFSQDNGGTNPVTGATGGIYRPTTAQFGAGTLPTGSDVFAVLLTVGIGLDE